MVHIKATTKRGKHFTEMYNNAKDQRIEQCYQKYSFHKLLAQSQCFSMMHEEEGYDFRIISYNTFQFTCGWKTPKGTIRIETAYNSYEVK